MKNILLFLCLLLGTIQLWSQRLDNDNRFKYTYEQQALNPLPTGFKTYSVAINGGSVSLSALGMTEENMIRAYCQLDQYQYVPTGGDFLLLIELGDIYSVNTETISKKETEGKGENAQEVTRFGYNVTYRIPMVYKFLDGHRNVIMEGEYPSNVNAKFKNSFGFYATKSELAEEWSKQQDGMLANWIKGRFPEEMTKFQQMLNSRHGKQIVTRNYVFYSIKKADKLGYEAQAEAISALQPIIESATVEAPLRIEDFGSYIDDWQAMLQAMDPQDKKQSVGFQMAAYNLGLAYALTNDFAKANLLVERLKEPGRRENMSENLGRIVTDLGNRYTANQTVQSAAQPTYDAAASRSFEEEQTSLRQAYELQHYPLLVGIVVRKETGDTLRGVIREHFEFNERLSGYILKGVYVEDMTRKENPRQFIEFRAIDFVYRDESMFIPEHIGAAALGLGIPVLMEALYGTKGLILGRSYGYESDEVYYWLKHLAPNRKGELTLKVHSLKGGVLRSMNEMLAKQFAEDCSIIVEKAINEVYEEENMDSFRSIIDDFAECKGTTIIGNE